MLQFLHATPDIPADGDPIALAIVLVVLAIFSVWVLITKRAAKKAVQAAPVEETPEVAPVLAPGAAGDVKLHDVDPKTAAMAMAIVADKLGKPLNELRFISIKEVK